MATVELDKENKEQKIIHDKFMVNSWKFMLKQKTTTD